MYHHPYPASLQPTLRRSEKKLGMTNVHWVWRGADVGFVASINPQPTHQPANPASQPDGWQASCHQAKLVINTPHQLLIGDQNRFLSFQYYSTKRADGKNSRYRYSEDFHKLITPLNQGK